MGVALNTRRPLRRTIILVVAAALAIVTGCATARNLGRRVLSPLRKSPQPYQTQPKGLSGFFSLRAGQDVIKNAIATYGGMRNWKAIEGLELEMVWKTVEGARVVEDPALVQMATGSPPQIRIYYSKLDQTFALGDKGPWAMMRGQPDRSPGLVARAHYTTVMMNFFLSLPFSLYEGGAVIRDVETKTWGGQTYDAVTVGFQGGTYPWQADSMTLWFRRPNSVIERCLFISTAPGSDFGTPPNSLWVTWESHVPLNDIPLARRWSLFRAEKDGAMKEKLFDIEVSSAVANRSFLPVLFREPIIEPPVPRSPISGEKPTSPLIIPKP
jgi:hypothetical protein